MALTETWPRRLHPVTLVVALAAPVGRRRRGLAAIFCVLLGAGSASALALDLADIVGGGDGTGNGTAAGINIATGGFTPTQATSIPWVNNTFASATHPFVDGVFIPDGGPGGSTAITISSTGLQINGISDSFGFNGDDTNHTWDHLWNGNNTGVSTTLVGAILGAHANKGITFDLDAIEGANPGMEVLSANLTAAMGSSVSGDADYYVFLDGALVASTHLGTSQADTVVPFGSLVVLPAQRFLTLVTSSNGMINSDWSFWLDPTVTLSVPEPGLASLFFMACLAFRRGVSILKPGKGRRCRSD